MVSVVLAAPDPQTGVHVVQVPLEYAHQRIDNFLLRFLKGVPRSMIYRMLRKGEVRVNRARIRPDYRLQAGDAVRIPPVSIPRPERKICPPPPVLARLENAILLEDRNVLVLNKPAGIAVHSGSGLAFGVIEALRQLRSEAVFLELAHRLDRETSGCLALAKTPAALRALHAAFQSGAMDKRYLTLVRGQWTLGEVAVSASLRKVLRSGERMMEVHTDGKPALTRFMPVASYREASLLEAKIATGRTHQIRVHAAYLGYPVAGDDKYGEPLFNRAMAYFGLRRLFLHAHRLTFHLDGRDISVDAPLGGELRGVLERLETDQ